MPDDKNNKSNQNRGDAMSRARGIFRNAATLNSNAEARRQRDETAFSPVQDWRDIPKAMKARFARNVELSIFQQFGAVGEAVFQARRANVGQKLSTFGDILKLHAMSALGGGSVIGEYFANKISHNVHFGTDPEEMAEGFNATQQAIGIEFQHIEQRFKIQEKQLKQITENLNKIVSGADKTISEKLKSYDGMKTDISNVAEDAKKAITINQEYARVTDRRIASLEGNMKEVIRRVSVLEDNVPGVADDNRPIGKGKFRRVRFPSKAVKNIAKGAAQKLGSKAMEGIGLFGRGVMGKMREAAMGPLLASGMGGTAGLLGMGALGAAGVFAAFKYGHGLIPGDASKPKTREEVPDINDATKAPSTTGKGGIDKTQLSFEEQQKRMAEAMKRGEKVNPKDYYKQPFDKPIPIPKQVPLDPNSVSRFKNKLDRNDEMGIYFQSMKREEDKKRFMLFGQMPSGFEFMPGHMGRLGVPAAVAASGAQPFGGGFGGGSFGGGGGSYFPGSGGVGAPSPEGTGYTIDPSRKLNNDMDTWKKGGGFVNPNATAAVLSEQRAKLFEEMDNDPRLKAKVQSLLMAENGGHPEGVLESMLNRIVAKQQEGKTNWSVKKEIYSGFYQPINRGEVGEKTNPRAQKAFDRVRAGSNDIDLRTDQGLFDEHKFADANPTIGRKKEINGEWYSAFGKTGVNYYEKTRKEIEERQKQLAEGAVLTPLKMVPKEALMGAQPIPGAGATASAASHVFETQQKVAGIRKLPITEQLKDYLDYSATRSGVNFEVSSGAQTEHSRFGRKGSFRHNIDLGTYGAADGRFFVRDDNGAKRYLSLNNPKDVPLIQKFTSTFSSVAPGAGVGTDYMGRGISRKQLFHFGGPNRPGGSPIAYSGPGWFRSAFAHGVRNQEQGAKDMAQWRLEKEEAIKAKQEVKSSVTMDEEKAPSGPKKPVPMSEQAITFGIPKQEKEVDFKNVGQLTRFLNSGGKLSEAQKTEALAHYQAKMDESKSAGPTSGTAYNNNKFIYDKILKSELAAPQSKSPAAMPVPVAPSVAAPEPTQSVDLSGTAPPKSDAERAGFSNADAKPVGSLDTIGGVSIPKPVDVQGPSPDKPAIAEPAEQMAKSEDQKPKEEATAAPKETGARSGSETTDSQPPAGGGRYNPESESATPGSSGYGNQGRCFV